jgi:hypothetical protein
MLGERKTPKINERHKRVEMRDLEMTLVGMT